MSVGDRIEEAWNRFHEKNYPSSLIQISIALDATSKLYFKADRSSRSNFKKFIHEHLQMITRLGGFPKIDNLIFAFKHPDIASKEGKATFQEIVYHVIRCSSLHNAVFPSNIFFKDDNSIKVENNNIFLPAQFISAMILIIVLCPVNAREKCDEHCGIIDNKGKILSINDLWGKRADWEKLLV